MGLSASFRTYYYRVEDDDAVYKFTYLKDVEKAKTKLPLNATVLFIEPIKDKFEVLWKRRK